MAVVVDCGAPETGHSASEAQCQGRGFARLRAQHDPAPAEDCGGPIDLVHLRRYTLGDRQLEFEVLGLFAGEAPVTLARVRAAASTTPASMQEWRNACHTLKGSARAVGAHRLAGAAEAAEKEATASAAVLASHIAAVAAAVAEVCAFIEGLHTPSS